MIYGTRLLLIGGGVFSGGSKKIFPCKGGHYMKNMSTQSDQQNDPNAEMRKKLSNIEKNFLARFAHTAFYKIHIS